MNSARRRCFGDKLVVATIHVAPAASTRDTPRRVTAEWMSRRTPWDVVGHPNYCSVQMTAHSMHGRRGPPVLIGPRSQRTEILTFFRYPEDIVAYQKKMIGVRLGYWKWDKTFRRQWSSDIVVMKHVTAPGMGPRYCDQRVCVSVSLSTRISQKPRSQTSRNFLYVLPVPVDRSFMTTMQYILWTALCFNIIRNIPCTTMLKAQKISVSGK